jgi:hypothetical protein
MTSDRRDELWEKYKEENPPKGQATLYYKDNAEYWKAGYDAAMAEKDELIRHYKFLLNAAENLYRPDRPVHKGLDPTFYHTLTYEGDTELINKTIAAREALKEMGE